MMSAAAYAVTLVADGAEHLGEDDLNENGYVAEEDHERACELAVYMSHAIRENAESFLAWVRPLIRRTGTDTTTLTAGRAGGM